MAHEQYINSGPPRQQRGQGAVEAILALPVFLILVCLIFQLFFLGIAQMQLHYAAFYAARVGTVNAADEEIMRQAVSKILAISPGFTSLSDDSFEVEIMNPEPSHEKVKGSIAEHKDQILIVSVHWNYPLIVPLADKLTHKNSLRPFSGKPSIRLKASWAMNINRSDSRNKKNGMP